MKCVKLVALLSGLGIALLGSLAAMPACHAQTPSPAVAKVSEQASEQAADKVEEQTVDPAAVRAAVRQLEAGQLASRDQAERELVAMGSNILPHLPEVTARTPGELKVRLQRIRQQLQQAQVETFFQASLVTLSGEFPVAEAIEKIAEQTGNAIRLDNRPALENVMVEVDAQRAEFWQVMSSIMLQASLRVSAFGTTENELVLTSDATPAVAPPPAFTSGPFRLDVTSVRSTLPLNSSLGGQVDVSFTVTWEPRLRPVYMQVPMSSVSAMLGQGERLTASNPQAAPEIPLNLGGSSTQIDLQLQRPDRSATQIEKLVGEFSVAVPSQRHEYTFRKFGSGARQSEKFGDVTVTLEGARRNGAVYEMRLFVEFGDPQGALDSFRGWILSNEAYLRGPDQTRVLNVGMNTYAITPNAVGIAYLFQINADPNAYELVYESPAAVSKQRVTYELTDIPLP